MRQAPALQIDARLIAMCSCLVVVLWFARTASDALIESVQANALAVQIALHLCAKAEGDVFYASAAPRAVRAVAAARDAQAPMFSGQLSKLLFAWMGGPDATDKRVDALAVAIDRMRTLGQLPCL